MADVLKIALDRREKLQQEMEKLDDFIRMAESLIRSAPPHAAQKESDGFGQARPVTPWRSSEAVA